MRPPVRLFVLLFASIASAPATAQEKADNYESWPKLQSTFASTGGGGFTIKGYDPVIQGGKCFTTFMAVSPEGQVFANFAEFEAKPAGGGTLCTNGKWRAFEGGASGTTPFRFFFKDGMFRAAPQS